MLVVEVGRGHRRAGRRRLAALGLRSRRDGRALLVPLADDETYDLILGAVAELDLPLHRLDQRRHRVAELFAEAAQPTEDVPCQLTAPAASSTTSATSGTPGRGWAAGTPSARSYAHGLRTAFGLGRSAKAKVFPWSWSAS